MKIGLFGGSFNPIHNGHVAIGRTMLRVLSLDEVWYVVSPQNPLKQQNYDFAPQQVRYEAVKAALQGEEGLMASDYEFHLPKPSYTWNTLRHLEQDYPRCRFTLIIGGDNWERFNRWAHAEDIIRNYQIAVFPRAATASPGVSSSSPIPHTSISTSIVDSDTIENPVSAEDRVGDTNPVIVNVPLINITSTDIRRMLRDGQDVSALVPKAVINYLDVYKITRFLR